MKPGFFIDRPVFSTVLSILIVIVGIIGLALLPVDQYPQITPPRGEDQRHVSGSERPDSVSSGRYPDRAGAERYARHDLYAK